MARWNQSELVVRSSNGMSLQVEANCASACVCYSSARRGTARIMSSSKREFLRTVPRKSLAIFLLGVFLLFSTVGLADDMTQIGRRPMLRLVLTLLFISTFSVLYAAAGFTLRGKSWTAFIPIFIVQYLIMKGLKSWMPSQRHWTWRTQVP